MTIDERVATARAAVREKERITQRLAEARTDRERIAVELAAAAELLASEKADVDRLQSGVGGLFRRIFASKADMTREQQEHAAAKLQHDALAEELKGADAYIADLQQRAAAVHDADATYSALLAEKATTSSSPELVALGAKTGQLQAARKELKEAIDAGRAAHSSLTSVLVAVDRSRNASYASNIGSDLVGMIGGATAELAADLSEVGVHEQMRPLLATAQQQMLVFQRECKDVGSAPMIGEVELPALPGVAMLIARDLVWTNLGVIDDIGAQVGLIETHLAQAVMELRGRDAKIEAVLTDLGKQRAKILDPH